MKNTVPEGVPPSVLCDPNLGRGRTDYRSHRALSPIGFPPSRHWACEHPIFRLAVLCLITPDLENICQSRIEGNRFLRCLCLNVDEKEDSFGTIGHIPFEARCASLLRISILHLMRNKTSGRWSADSPARAGRMSLVQLVDNLLAWIATFACWMSKTTAAYPILDVED